MKYFFDTCRKQFLKLIPSYSVLPLILIVVINFSTYFGTRFFTAGMPHHSMKIFLDDHIPLNTWFIYVYILAYVQWIAGFIMIAREEKSFSYRIFYGEIIAKLICLLFFIFYPTTIIRPEITGNALTDILTRYIYQLDAPDNLFPSIHCLESYICFRGALGLKKGPKWYPYITFIFSVLVFASTVCLKQHVFLDIPGAVLSAEIGIFLSGRILKKKFTS